MYPHLSHMALDYLCIPATSINIEHLFSIGWVLMPYLHNCLSSQTTHVLLCLGHWSKLGLIKDEDLHKVISEQPELPGDDLAELELADCDLIHRYLVVRS
ncbi:hypothetical protein PISMIDRAFT_120806 [Pisolithus microcarpus 441]|uniref:HAT C-terminal dimerisation domain-containing protein n=1 Tax=Pisolithus microcarpus 441 TaxID=765257 RepID=A0A0C9Y6H4_9AGAM|nr:hypothetical protein PISMIDRAFT_120806 [Pisolithus microcarpus 441]